ncbi:hypothetical protein AB0869_24050 [Micromonospora vinacea]
MRRPGQPGLSADTKGLPTARGDLDDADAVDALHDLRKVLAA